MSTCTRVAAVAILALAVSVYGQGGEMITVTTSADVVDFGGNRQIQDLPGPDGKVSLAEAGQASDNTPGVQTIGFEVPQNEWEFQWLYPGRLVLRPFLGFRVFDTVILDGTTQTRYTGDTYPDGAEVVIWAETYLNDCVGGEVRGFDHSSLNISGGSGNVVQGNTDSNITVYDSPGNLIGGTRRGDGNTGGTIKIDRASDNVIIGNTISRVRILGWVGGNMPAVANRLGGPALGERNYITGYGTFNGEGCPSGTTVQIFDSIDTVVENNWIGTTPDGMSQGNEASIIGVGFEGENYGAMIINNRIGGILARGRGPHCTNLLYGYGITVYGTGSDFTIQGNTIGLNANDEPVLGSVYGIATLNYYLGPVQRVSIGGTERGEANVIAGHRLSGVVVTNEYGGVHISGNSIFDNGGLGIDLTAANGALGVTPNDQFDGDVGGNGLQNFPVLREATSEGGSTRVAGALNSRPVRDYIVEFFASEACDSTGHGEGGTFLGWTRVTTDGDGDARFNVTLDVGTRQGNVVTATATDEGSGDTSEFSACVQVGGGGGLDCDAIKTLTAKCKRGKLTAKVKSSLPDGAQMTVSRNGGDPQTLTVNGRGKGKVKWKNVTGIQTVAIVECQQFEREAVCP